MMKLVAILLIIVMATPIVALADQLGDREPRDEGELIDLLWWYRSAGIVTPFWETSSFWGDVWGVVSGARGEWWR